MEGAAVIASDLSQQLWNGIADLVRRSGGKREIYFVTVTRNDKVNNLVWAKDFGDVAIPLVAHTYGFAYYDTVPDEANLGTGAISRHQVRREDKTNANSNFKTHIICPKVGEVIVVLDPWGAKRYPICIGVIHSGRGAWEGE